MTNTTVKRHVTWNGTTIEYMLTIKRVKNINLRVAGDGTVHVSANAYVPEHRIDAYVLENMAFIERARFKLEALEAKRVEALLYISGETVSVLGIPVTLTVEEQEGKPHIVFDGVSRMIMYIHKDASFEKKHALMQTFWRQLGTRVFQHWARVVYERFQRAQIDVPMPTVKQQRMKSRWGSCTPSKDLIKMNTRLLEGPQAYIEYVMVHEFAHFKYPDHSKNFHQLVGFFLPDWKARKKALNLYFAYRR